MNSLGEGGVEKGGEEFCMRWMLMTLFLTAAASAEGSPREWVLSIDDLKGKLGANYRPSPRKETFQHGDFVISGYYVYTYTDSKRGLFWISQVNRDPSSWDAKVSFLGAKYGFQNSQMVDESKSVAAGEESRSRRSADGKEWMFIFRQRRVWGTLMLNGLALTPKEMDALVDRYVARVELVQTRKPVAPKPKGIWRWP